MRTSKKLLSLFLAVVMVITTCSVGFTAFAKDYDNIWSDSSEAEDAFKALNGLADSYLPSALMGVDLISNGVYKKYAKEMGKDVKDLTDKEKEEIASKATLQDILTVLQPTLIGALAKESQAAYAERVGGSNPKNPSYYDYLLKDDGSLDFFTLYALCADYRTNSELSKETRNQLEEWYFQLREIYNLGVATDVVDTTVKELGKEFVDEEFSSPYTNASLYALESFYNDEYLSSKCDEETLAAIQAKCSEITEEYLAYGAPEDFVVDSYGEMVYYGYGAAKNLKYAYAYSKAVELAEEKITYSGSSDPLDLTGTGSGDLGVTYTVTDAITPENCTDLLYGAYLNAALREMEMIDDSTELSTKEAVAILFFGYDPTDPNSQLPPDEEFASIMSLLDAYCISDFYNSNLFAQNYNKIIKGLTIQYSDDIADADAFDALVNAKMPENYRDGNVFTESEIKTIASAMRSLNSSDDVTNALRTGTVSGKDVFDVQIDTTLPSGMQSTYLGEYLALINDESQSNSNNTLQSYKLKVWNGFYSQYVGNNNFPWFLLNDGTPVTISQVTDKSQVMRDADTNLPVLNYDGATFNNNVINQTVLDAERYAYTQIAAEYLGIDSFVRNSTTSLNIDINFESFVKSKAPQKPEIKVELTPEQKEILYADYDLTGEVGTEIVDCILNSTIGGIVSNDIVANVVNCLVTTDVDLESALTHIWQRICDNPVSTIFELVPILVVLVDELVLPLALNSGVPEGESYGSSNTGITFDMEAGILDYVTIDSDLIGGVLSGLLGMSLYFKDMSYDSGSYIGIKHLGWDLNTLLPNLMHWLLASKEDQKNKDVAGITYYVDSDTTVPVYYTFEDYENQTTEQRLRVYTGVEVVNADFDHYDVKDSLGNSITREVTGTDENGNQLYKYTYGDKSGADINDVVGADSNTEFNCYMTYEAKVPYLTGIYIADKALADARISDLGKLLGNSISDKNLANGLAEVITELATLFGASVDEFVNSDRVNQIRYKNGNRLFAGLNNVFVALPQLLDIMEDLAADKYGIDRNAWTFCYDGKISSTSDGNLAGPSADKKSTINAPLEKFKSYAGSDDENRSVDILDGFVSLVIEDWLNAIVSIVNNVVATDNTISQNLPIIMSLLNSLGGFGEDSVFTDILNGIFQLKRGDENSFEFKLQDNGFTGLSNENAYFLFSNIDTLVKVIMSLVDSFQNSGDDTETVSLSSTAVSLLSSFSAKTAKAAPVGASGYTAEELSAVDSLITKLDEMISSLLSKSSINDYAINNTGNIASGIVSLLSNYISSDDAESLVGLLDSYLYYLNGADARTADENGNMKPEDVYTNENLSELIVRTFALLENIVQDLLANYDYVTGEGDQQKSYNLLASAINGVISPDSIGVRLDDYSDAQEKILDLKNWNSAIKDDGSLASSAKSIDWNVTDGDKDQFFKGLASSLRLVTSVLGVIFVDAGIYENALQPILNTIGSYLGFTVDTAEEFADAGNPYRDEVLLGLLKPLVAFLDKFLEAPVTTLVKTEQAIAAILDDSNTEAGTIATIVSNTIKPIANELLGVAAILNVSSDKLKATSPTLAAVVEDLVNTKIAPLAVIDENGALANIKIKDVPLSGSNLIPILNALLSSTGIVLNAFDWKALSEAASPADALAFNLKYVFDFIQSNNNLGTIVGLIAGEGGVSDTLQTVIDAIQSDRIDLTGIVTVILKVLNITKNPTIFAWSFEKYLQEAIEGFSYPLGLTKTQADEAVTDIDAVINNIFPLLQSLGINLGGTSLKDIVNNNLFTNKMLTTLAVSLYGAMSSNATVVTVLDVLGIKTSTADFAALLNDTSYGATFSAAADAIGAKASWAELKTVTKNDKGEDVTTYADINWGFTDGAANAQQGFVNALVAILRPLNDVLAVFLNSESLKVGSGLYDVIASINVESKALNDNITLAIENGVVTLVVVDAANAGSKPSTIKLDLTALDALKDFGIYGTNAYNSAIIPLLEALQCKDVVTEAQYKADVAAAKDNLLLDILNPILGGKDTSVLNQIVAAPLQTICTLLPNLAVYIDANGITQLLANLLAPVSEIIYSLNEITDVNELITSLVGMSLGDYLASILGMKAGSLTIDLTDLSSINVQDVLIPVVNMLLKSNNINITISDINWNALISLGERTTYTSAATDVNGNALTGKAVKNVDYGKVLITVLRYVLNNVISNIDAIQTLVMGITTDQKTGAKLSDNKTLAPILNNVFTQIKTHTSDELIVALYYFFVGSNTDTYWNYSNYKTKANTFKFPDGVNEATVAKLISFIDGIVEEIDLNGLLNQYLYTDSIINSLAKLIYTNIEKTKISDGIMLDDILEIVGISADSNTVAAMLADSKYGETKQFKTAADTIAKAGKWASVNFDTLTWGVKDQETFLKALVAILRPFEGLLDVLLADGQLKLLEGISIPGSNDYVNSIVPLLEAFRCKGIKSYDKYLADKNKAYDNLLLDVLTPLFGFVNDVVANPIDTIASVLPNVALFIGNNGLVQLVENLLTPIVELIKQINPIIDVDKLLQDLTKIPNISVTNIGKFIEPFVGGGNLIALANKYLAAVGLKIPEIDWLGLASLGTTKKEASAVTCIGDRIVVDGNSSQVIVAVLRYVLNVVLDNQVAIKGLIGKSYTGALKDILDMVFAMSADDLLKLVFSLVEITQSPTEVFWSYEKYKSKFTKFKYPDGITADDAERAVAQLDNAVGGVFALLQGLGVVDSDNLSGLVNDLLFKNELLTQLAVTLYGALDSETVGPYLEMAGIAVSPKAVAQILTDKSYGKTFSSAAKVIGSKSSWSKLKTVKKDKDGKETTTYASINWGFTNGAANAEQGFINALTAIFRPFLDIIGPFLNGTNLELGNILYGVVTKLDINTGDQSKGETLVTLKNGLLTIKTQSNGVYSTALELNLANLETLKTLNLYGENAYENAIIPLLDVIQVDNSEIKTYDEYVKDCKKAKDNILLDVLNPLMSFIDKVLEAPFDTITSVLPNLAYFIDNNGIGQLLDNLLSPITEWLKGAKKDGLDIDKILNIALGKDLGTFLTEMLKIKGVKLNVKLTDLSSLNIQEIVVPLINSLLKKTGIKLPDFEWATIASHGEVVTSKSKAENSTGKFTNKEVIADKGETLVAVLRYVANVLVTNAKSLKTLLGSIDAIKKNDTIKSVINSVFNTINTSSADSIVCAVFYFLCGEPTNAFWDYTAYKTGEYTFTYPESVDTDFLKNLPPMLDGLIGGLADLNGLIGENLFKDELISKMAVGLYGAIEKVSISGDTSLTDLLAQTGIDFSTENVANLLVDEDYGQTFQSAASVIKNAGSWANVSADSLKWGVKDRDSFFHALVAVLRPIYGVLDVLLNSASLGIFDIVRIPGSNGYTSSIVPLMEAFSMYNIKTQYQYREDIKEAYDNILLDIINPLWDKIEDLLNAPLQTLASMVPNLALFIGNDGLCQIIDNLLTPVSALVDAIKPIINLNDLLEVVFDALNVDLGSILGKIGITNFSLDIYDLNATLKQVLGGDAIIPLINNILGIIKIGGQPLGLKLNPVDWLQLASHGKTIVSASQAATYGSRIFVEGDSSETLIAVLRYLIETVNAGDNFDKISSLIGGLLGDGASDTVTDVINQVLGALQGDTDEVIAALVELLQMLA